MFKNPGQFLCGGIIIFSFLLGNFFNLPVFGAGEGQNIQIEVAIPGETPTPTPTPTPTATPTATATPPPAGGGGGATPPPKFLKTADFNRDGKVNIIDLSIMLFYSDKSWPITDPYDLNDDAKLDLIDISIFLYYWSG